MNFISYKGINDRLVDKNISDREILPYVIVFFMGSFISILTPHSGSTNAYDYIIFIVNILFSIIGTLFLYKKNNGSNGYNFLVKYVILSWILGIRSLIIVVPCYIIYRVIIYKYYNNTVQSTCATLIIHTLYLLIFFNRLGKHFSVLRNKGEKLYSSDNLSR